MKYSQFLLGSTSLARPVFSALLPVVSLLTIDPAMATDYFNLSGVTINTTMVLDSTYLPVDTYTNQGEIVVLSGTALYLGGTSIGAVINSGTISGPDSAVEMNGGSIPTIQNSGTLVGNQGIYLHSGATVGTLTNSNLIFGRFYALEIGPGATVTDITNTAAINGSLYGIVSGGTIGTLTNSGTISGTTAAIGSLSGGSIGTLNNSGLISGDILSDQGLLINGASSGMGTLTGLSGGVGSISIASGDLTFGSGNLLLNDNISVAGHTVANTGANLYVGGSMVIVGGYTQAAGASLNVNVGAGAVATGDMATDHGYGRLMVTGAANIASGSSVNLVSQGYGFASGQRFLVIRAQAAGTDYNASTLNYSAQSFTGVLSGAAVTSGSTKDLVVSLSGVAGPSASTPNASSSLAGLQNYSGTSNAELLNLYNASLAIGSTAEANKAGEQLSPVFTTASAGAAAASSTFDMLDVIGNHVNSLRGSDAGSRGAAAGDATMDWGAWGQAFGGRADQDTSDQVSGYRAYYGGFVTGIDRAVTDSWRLGGALSYTRTNVDGAGNVDGSQTNVDSYGLTAYASYTGKPWYANLFVSGAEQSYHSKRLVSFTGFSGLANGDFDGQQFAAKAEIGYPIALTPRLTLTPLADLSYSYSRLDDYTETGGNGAALKVDGSDSYALRSGIGGKLATTVSTSFGEVVPFIQAMWLHQYNDGRTGVTAQYAGDPLGETAFTSFGAKPIADMADLTVGATLLSSDDFSVTARYGAQLAPDYTNQTLSLRIRQLF